MAIVGAQRPTTEANPPPSRNGETPRSWGPGSLECRTDDLSQVDDDTNTRRTVSVASVRHLGDLLFAQLGWVAYVLGINGYMHTRIGGPDTYKHEAWRPYFARDWATAQREIAERVTFALAAGERPDVYWCPAPRATRARTQTSCVAELDVLWADLDEIPADAELLVRLDPYMVASGSADHRHIYVPLSRLVPLAQHQALNRALATRLGADAKWSHEALLRVPETINYKHGGQPVEQLAGGGRVWDPVELAALLDVDLELAGSVAVGPVAAQAPAPIEGEWPRRVVEQFGKPVTDRSAAAHALVGACKSAGLTLGQAHTVTAQHAPSVEKYGDRLAGEVERSWVKCEDPRPAAPVPAVIPASAMVPAVAAERAAAAEVPGRRLRMVRASAVTPRAAQWLWRTGEFGRIPLGEVSVAAGRGNVGKSPWALWSAARLTRGELPGELFGSPVDVVIYASEDSHEHTTVPRLTAAGADLDRVHLLNGTETDEDPEMPLVWSRDIDLIREAIEQTGARMLVIDPLIDVHRGGANTDRTDDVRAGLRPLVALAHRTGSAVVGIAHFNKQRTGDVASLLSGSHGLRDTVRAVLAFVERPDGERVLGQDKNNLGRAGDDVPRLTYDMASVDVLIEGVPVSQPVFTITGTTDDTLSDILLGSGAEVEVPEDTAWLFELVAAGHPLPLHASKLATEAEARGLKWDTVSRKARRTGLVTSRQQRGAVHNWVWSLTDEGARRAGKPPAPAESDCA